MYSKCPICKKNIFKQHFRNHWLRCYHNYSLLYYQYIRNLQINKQQQYARRQQNYRQTYSPNYLKLSTLETFITPFTCSILSSK